MGLFDDLPEPVAESKFLCCLNLLHLLVKPLKRHIENEDNSGGCSVDKKPLIGMSSHLPIHFALQRTHRSPCWHGRTER